MSKLISSYYTAALACLLCSAALCSPGTASARISGDVSLGYEDYREKRNGDSTSTSSFQQLYSLVYSTPYKRSKFGNYNFTLGYEWGAVNYTENSSDQRVSAGHLLYGGEYNFESRTVPLKVMMFSRDLNRLSINSTYSNGVYDNEDSVIPSGVARDLYGGGVRNSSGITIFFGERDPDLLTANYPRFADIPKIYIDYRNDFTRDLRSSSPEHMRQQTLNTSMEKGLLSVNYKLINLKDYLQQSSYSGGSPGYNEQSISVGHIDRHNTRKWENLTNWIQVSADGGMVKRVEVNDPAASFTEYQLNLFATAQRKTWQARTFNTFMRTSEGDNRISDEIRLPLYIDGSFGADNSWQVLFQHRNADNTFYNFETHSDVSSPEKSTTASARLEAFKRSTFTLTPSLSLIMSDTSYDGKKFTIAGSIETSSTRRFSDRLALSGSYRIERTNEENAANTTTNIKTLQVLTGKALYRVDKQLIASAEQTIVANSGTSSNTISSGTNTGSLSGNYVISSRTEVVNDDLLASITKAKLSWTPKPRVTVNTETALEVNSVSSNNDLETLMKFSGDINYSMPAYTLQTAANYVRRDLNSIHDQVMSISGQAVYSPSQNINSSVSGTYSMKDESGLSSNQTYIRQQLSYFFVSSKFRRKLIELRQESTLEESDETTISGSYNSVRRLSLQSKYYFNTNVYASALARYSILNPGDVSEWMGGATLGMQYKLLQGNVEYFQGKRSGNNDNRVERRFSAHLKKQF